MDIKFEKEEVLFLIEKFARKSVKLHLNTIEISIVDDKYIKLAHQLNVVELNDLACELSKDVAIQESKQSCTKIVIAYHNVATWVSFGNIKIENHITIQSSNKSFNEVHYHENDLIIDTRIAEYEAQEEYERGCDNSVYGNDYDDYDYDYDEDDYDENSLYDTEEDLIDNPAKDNESVDVDELNDDLDEALK